MRKVCLGGSGVALRFRKRLLRVATRIASFPNPFTRNGFPGFVGILKRESGAAEGTRTPDPIITNDVLYHLSYSGLVAGYYHRER